MEITGKEVLKLFDHMQGILDVGVTDLDNNSDAGSFVALTPTPLEVLHEAANINPDKLFDIKLVSQAVFDALIECSNDATSVDRAAKIVTALNANFNERATYLNLLVDPLLDNYEYLPLLLELEKCLQAPVFKNSPQIINLLELINTHKLYLEIQQWEAQWHKKNDIDVNDMDLFSYVEEQLSKSRDALFKQCDDLLIKSPHEFKKMLAHKDFPALFLLWYLNNDYHRELSIIKLDNKILVTKLAASVHAMLDMLSYSYFIKDALSKIGLAFEAAKSGIWDLDETREILMPLIMKLIKTYSSAPKDEDSAHIQSTILNLLGLVKSVNIADTNGNTPLHVAIQPDSDYVHLDLVKSLLSRKANVAASNTEHQTPLSLAAKYLSNADADKLISEMIKSQPLDINTLEKALVELLRRSDYKRPLSNSKAFEALVFELNIFPEWSASAFFKKYDVLQSDSSNNLAFHDVRKNIFAITDLVYAMQHFGLPLKIFFDSKIKINEPATLEIVGALLANSSACKFAENEDSNVFEYLQQHPEICDYLNHNMDAIMITLQNIKSENEGNFSHYSSKYYAYTWDILKICRFNNSDSPEYVLFTLRILVEQVFSTQFVPVSLISWLPDNSPKVVEEQVKQQLKSSVFAMIERDVNIEPIKEYLKSRASGMNQIFFMGFVQNFLNDIDERETAQEQTKHPRSTVMLPYYGSLDRRVSRVSADVGLTSGKVSTFSSKNELQYQ